MANNWIYAKLSEAAKEAGGPEAFVKSFVKFGEKLGRKEMLCFFPAVFICGGICEWTINLIVEKRKQALDKSEMEVIVEKVADYYNVNICDLTDGRNDNEYALPRQIAFYLCIDEADVSPDDISYYFNTDHTKVINGHMKIRKRIDNNDLDVVKAVDEIRKKSLTARKVQI